MLIAYSLVHISIVMGEAIEKKIKVHKGYSIK